MTPEDIEHLQTIGRDAQDARKEFILKDDQSTAWEHIMTLKDARIDFVLDNGESIRITSRARSNLLFMAAGFEVGLSFRFLCPTGDTIIHHSFSLISSLPTFLYPTPHTSLKLYSSQPLVPLTCLVSSLMQSHSPKSIPWFVSDVTPLDFAALLDVATRPRGPEPDYLEHAIARWNAYLANGTFSLSVPRDAVIGTPDERINFWTSPWPYWDMHLRAPRVWDSLRESGLVIFKVRALESKILSLTD
jgi:hypothetical protein